MTLFSLVKWDPRCKIILMACLSTLAMLRGEVWFLFGLLVFTCLLVMLGGAELSGALGQVKGLLGLIFSLFIIQCFFTRSGEPWLVIGGFTLITSGGIELACILSLRLFILAFSALLLLTGEVRDYLLALVQMKIPYEIAFMTMASVHFIPILREEALNVFYAIQLRGCELQKASWRKKLHTYLEICLPILVGALKRTRAMALAMEARAFRAYPKRTYLRRLVLKKNDKAILVAVPVITLVLLVY
ncbi:MAG: energy-coupling factor transporter transmembrane protein EcfT [Firmicutes bacterium]|jgi:energy-coupling factor transport system permease protein|nr:energy-coupling factor transporter transmembrane protein EcfT [Bacillota bacterium]